MRGGRASESLQGNGRGAVPAADPSAVGAIRLESLHGRTDRSVASHHDEWWLRPWAYAPRWVALLAAANIAESVARGLRLPDVQPMQAKQDTAAAVASVRLRLEGERATAAATVESALQRLDALGPFRYLDRLGFADGLMAFTCFLHDAVPADDPDPDADRLLGLAGAVRSEVEGGAEDVTKLLSLVDDMMKLSEQYAERWRTPGGNPHSRELLNVGGAGVVDVERVRADVERGEPPDSMIVDRFRRGAIRVADTIKAMCRHGPVARRPQAVLAPALEKEAAAQAELETRAKKAESAVAQEGNVGARSAVADHEDGEQGATAAAAAKLTNWWLGGAPEPKPVSALSAVRLTRADMARIFECTEQNISERVKSGKLPPSVGKAGRGFFWMPLDVFPSIEARGRANLDQLREILTAKGVTPPHGRDTEICEADADRETGGGRRAPGQRKRKEEAPTRDE